MRIKNVNKNSKLVLGNNLNLMRKIIGTWINVSL